MFWNSLGDLCRISLFRKVTVRRQCLYTSDTCSPKSLIDRVLGLLPAEIESVLLKEIDLELTCKAIVAHRSNDLYLRCKYLEYNVETYLVIAGSRASVSYRICTKLIYVLKHFKRLENALRTHRKGICRILEDIAVYEIFDSLVVVCVDGIDILVRCCTECQGTLLDSGFFLRRESTCIYHDCMYLIALLLEVWDTE